MKGGAEVYLPQRKVQEANLPRLEMGMALRYTIGEERGRTFAENLSVIETAVPNKVSDRKVVTNLADPVDEFEREWGLRRQ